MSTRSARKTIITSSVASTSSSSETPKMSTPGRHPSPLSPTRLSRLQEKAELQNLNDRLAAYIDRVRHLETENSRLNMQVETIQESVQKEVISMKGLYEQELSDARKLLDDTSKEKAQLQIDVGKLKTENEDLKLKLLRKERDLAAAEKSLTQAEGQVLTLTARLNTAESDRKKLAGEIRELRDEVAKLTRQLGEAKQQLEAETLMRVDLENRCQSLREELAFKGQVHEQEITETKKWKQIEISELDGQLQVEYEERLQKALQELREQYEEQLKGNRDEIEAIYETKIEDLTRRATRSNSDASAVMEQLRESRSKLQELSSKITDLESTNSALAQKVAGLEALLDAERESHGVEISRLQEEIDRLRDEMSAHLQEYQDLMDVKVALDMEIAAYRKLLESEEMRLNITPSRLEVKVKGGETPVRRTPIRGMKRKRTVVEEDVVTKSAFQSTARSAGEMNIEEDDPEGQFVKLQNKSDKEIVIGGCQVVREVGDDKVAYKFHRTVKVPAEGVVTIWSMDTGATHEPPLNLVMKSQKWIVGDTMSTKLLSSDEEEMAVRESKRQKESFSTTLHREFGGLPEPKEEDEQEVSRLYSGCTLA